MTGSGPGWWRPVADHLRHHEPFEATIACAKAVTQATPAALALAWEELDDRDAGPAAGSAWVGRLLLLALAVRGDAGWRRTLAGHATPGTGFGRGPVCLVVGSTAEDADLAGIEPVLRSAFRGYRGTLVSGGTTQGVAGVVGGLGQQARAQLTTVGYAPRAGTVEVNHAYHDLRHTDGGDFTPWEALQCWTDLVASGVDPAAVCVLGVGGGRISAVEYRVALALGAWVGVLRDSDRAVTALLRDPDWCRAPRLVALPADPAAIRAFVDSGPSAAA